MASLEPLFRPRSIAVLGASQDPEKQGHRWFRSLLRSSFAGRVFAVNPKGGELLGHRVYADLAEIDDKIDLLLSTLSPDRTRDILLAAARRGTPFALLFTAGYAEMGPEGAELQRDLVRALRPHGMRIVGPNSMGLFNFEHGLDLKQEMNLPRGEVSVVSQSGNIMLTLWHEAPSWGLGFRICVHFGNQADIPVHEYLAYLGEDPGTKVILLYLEGLQRESGAEFVRVARKVSERKPIVAVKGGRTAGGVRAAASHTAALAGERRAYEGAFRAAGIVEVERLDEALPVVQALLSCPPMQSDDVAVIGSGGGHSVLLVDALEERGLRVPAFDRKTARRIAAKLPAWAPTGNPVDMTGAFTGDLTLFSQLTTTALSGETDFGGVVNYGLYGRFGGAERVDRHGHTYETAAPLLGRVQESKGKPVVFYSPYARSGDPAFSAMRCAGIPCVDSIEVAAACLRGLRDRAKILQRLTRTRVAAVTRTSEGASEVPSGWPGEGPNAVLGDGPGKRHTTLGSVPRGRESCHKAGNLTEVEALALLVANGIPVAPYLVAHTVDAALSAADALGYPVVLKAVSPDIIHKTDVGAVLADIRGPEELAGAYERIGASVRQHVGPDALEGLLVASYLGGGVEVIVGAVRDSTFGPMIIVGAGGILAEVIDEVAVALAPLSALEARDLLADVPRLARLGSARGRETVDLGQLERILVRLSKLMVAFPQISEIDLNPVIVRPDGAFAADARVICSRDAP